MKRLYLLYFNSYHEDVVHSFSTDRVGDKNKAKKCGRKKQSKSTPWYMASEESQLW
jgi:hypothetical protein